MDAKKDYDFQKDIELENRVAVTRGEESNHKPKVVLFINKAPCNSQCRSAILIWPPNIAYSRVPSLPCAKRIAFDKLQENSSTHSKQVSISSHMPKAFSSPGLSHCTLDGSISKNLLETAPSGSNGPTLGLNLEHSATLPPILLTSTSTAPQSQVAPSYIQETDLHSQEPTISTVSDVNFSDSTGRTSELQKSSRSKQTSSLHSSISSHSKQKLSLHGSTSSYSRGKSSPTNHVPASFHSRTPYLPFSNENAAPNSRDLSRFNLDGPPSENSLKIVPFSSQRPMLLLPISLSSASSAPQPLPVPSHSQKTDLHSQEATISTLSNANSSDATQRSSPGTQTVLSTCGSSSIHLRKLYLPIFCKPSSSKYQDLSQSNLDRPSSIALSSASPSPQPQVPSSYIQETVLHSEKAITTESEVNSFGSTGLPVEPKAPSSQGSSSLSSKQTSSSHGSTSYHSQESLSPTTQGPASSHLQEPYLPTSREFSAFNSQELLHFNLDVPSSENPVITAPFGSHETLMALNLDQSAPLSSTALISELRAPQPQAPSDIQETDLHSHEVTISTVRNINYFYSTGQNSSESQRSTSLPSLGRPYPTTHGPISSPSLERPCPTSHDPASSHLLETHLSTTPVPSTSSSQGLSQFNLEEPASGYLLESTPSGSHGSMLPIASSSVSPTSVPQGENQIASDERVREVLPSSRPEIFVRPRPVQSRRRRTARNEYIYRPYPHLQPPRSYCLTDNYLDMDTTLFPELYM